MSNGIVLPPLNVSAIAPSLSVSSLGLTGPMPSPAVALAMMHPRRLQKYAEGYWREMTVRHMEEVSRNVSFGLGRGLTNEFMIDLNKIPLADKYMCLNPHALPSEAIRAAIYGWGVRRKISEARELSGGILSAFAAYGHYFSGEGADVSTNINRLGVVLSAANVPGLDKAFSSAMIGSSPINLDKVPYSTWDGSWITGTWLGHITLKIEGVVHKSHSGRMSFEGIARAYNDTFDFNASTHRAGIGELATTMVRALGAQINPAPYQIVIQGELPISIRQ